MMPDSRRPTEGESSRDRLRLWLKLLKTTSAIEDELRRRLRHDFASTLPRFDVMSALERHPEGLKMSQISELLRVSNGNVTGIVDRLVEDGVAIREAVPGDRRASCVRLTGKGLEEFLRQASRHNKWVDELLGSLGAAEACAMAVQLDQVLEERAQ